MNEKERLLKVLKKEKVDRPPVICPGGMMNSAVTEVLKEIEGNHNVELESMVEAAIKTRELTGFENYGVPFCMTVEAEPFEVEIDFGSKKVEPLVKEYNEKNIKEIMEVEFEPYRMKTVIEAIEKLKNDKIPVIGNITGAMSTATSVVDPIKFFKMLRKKPDEAMEFLTYINEHMSNYALQMIEAGADVIAFSDPTATGEILGEKNFEKFIVPLYKKIVNDIHKKNTPVILHICGNSKKILKLMEETKADAISVDSVVSIKSLKETIQSQTMGNINTHMLHDATKEKIKDNVKLCLSQDTNIVAPACGLGMNTPLTNIRAMTDTVKEYRYDL